jgi:hemerythrin-like domain-containing protein
MKPIGPLMVEHRLIERMIPLLRVELKQISRGQEPDIEFLTTAVDFLQVYADKTHHGKEEGILFREMKKKELFEEHNKNIKQLSSEHVHFREIVMKLDRAKDSYSQGNKESVDDILSCLSELVTLYPEHIYKEDKRFFYPSLDYFTRQEQDAMLDEFREFDSRMAQEKNQSIHEKYRSIVESLENSKKLPD